MAALRRLAEHCEFGTTLEESLRDRLVCGISNETIQCKLLTERDLTLARAYEIARSMETAQRQATQLQAVSQTAKEGQTSQEIHPVTREKGKGTDKMQCWRCGRTGHEDEKCYFRRKQCRKCNKYGHIAKMCKSETEGGTERKVHHTEVEEELTDLGLFAVDSGTDKNTDSFFAELGINGTPVRMEVDTGAAVTPVSEGVWEDKLGKIPLEDTDVVLRTYTGERLKVLGQAMVDLQHQQNPAVTLPLIVVAGNGPALLGRNWLQAIKLDWGEVKKIKTELDRLLEKHGKLFEEGLGKVKNYQVNLSVCKDAAPKFVKPRAVPYALKESIH